MADRKEQVSLSPLTQKYRQKEANMFIRNNHDHKLAEEISRSAVRKSREKYWRCLEQVKQGAVECDEDKMKEIIINSSNDCELLVIGEQHGITRHREIVSDCFQKLKLNGVKYLALEYLPSNLQDSIDRFDKEDVEKIKRHVEKGWGNYGKDAVISIMHLIFQAKVWNVRIIGLDKSLDLPEEEYKQDREKSMFSMLGENLGKGKVLLMCGNDHSTSAKKEFKDVKVLNIEMNGDGATRDNKIYLMRAIFESGLNKKTFFLEKGSLNESDVSDYTIHFAEEKG